MGFSCSSVDKESACNAGNLGLIPGLGRSPGEGNGNTLQYSCLENPMYRGSWQASVHGVLGVGHELATKSLPGDTTKIVLKGEFLVTIFSSFLLSSFLPPSLPSFLSSFFFPLFLSHYFPLSIFIFSSILCFFLSSLKPVFFP